MNAEDRLQRYVDATVDGVIGDLASTAGGRNEAVRDASVRLGIFVAQGLISEDVAVSRLLEAARANGYVAKDGEREARSTIQRSLRYGIAEGAMPDELERILRDVTAERSAPSSAPTNGRARTNGAHVDELAPSEMRVTTRPPPPLDEVRALWAASDPVALHPHAAEYLRSRGIDAVRLDDEGLARIAGGELPPWARGWAGRLLVPLYDVRGVMRSLVARDVTGRAERKSLAPGGDSRAPDGYGRKELVMACGRSTALLHAPEPARLVVCEGEIDFLVAATQRSDADESGALGLFTGSWSKPLAARIKDGSTVVIATDADEAGEKYCAAIIESLKARKVHLSRWRGESGADVAKAGGLAHGTITPIDPNGWRTPAERALGLGAHSADPMPTGFETLDQGTRGGLRAGKLIVVAGAPGAGKTTWSVQVARGYCLEGYPVGVLACDEDADGLLIRMGQQWGLTREDLEQGIYAARKYLSAQTQFLPLVLVDADEDEATIEDVAERIHAMAQEIGKPGVLLVDSIQKARCREHTVTPSKNERERIDATVRALKRVSRGLGLLVLATSEATRALYRGGADPKINPLAAGKESGSIEYAAALQLVLQSVPGESDLVDVAMPKNRIGSSRDTWRVRLDRDRARFAEVDVEGPEQESAEDQERRDEARDAKLEADAVKLLTRFLEKRAQGIQIKSRSDLRELAKGKTTWRNAVVAHLFTTGRLVGGNGKPIEPPSSDPDPDPDPDPDQQTQEETDQ